MLCRFCIHDFGEIGGRDAVMPILTHMGKEHPIELMNLCVRLPFQDVGGHLDGVVYEEAPNNKIRPIRTPEMNRELLMLQADQVGIRLQDRAPVDRELPFTEEDEARAAFYESYEDAHIGEDGDPYDWSRD